MNDVSVILFSQNSLGLEVHRQLHVNNYKVLGSFVFGQKWIIKEITEIDLIRHRIETELFQRYQ